MAEACVLVMNGIIVISHQLHVCILFAAPAIGYETFSFMGCLTTLSNKQRSKAKGQILANITNDTPQNAHFGKSDCERSYMIKGAENNELDPVAPED